MSRFLAINLLLSLIFSSTVLASDELSVIYPREAGRDKASSYEYSLLNLALSKSGVPYQLKLTDSEMNEERARRTILSGSDAVSVMSAGTRVEFEEQLKAIYIPLYGGLIGHRVFIIHEDNLDMFSEINTLQELSEYTSGQGHAWPDVDVLRESGLKVETAEYSTLFRLVEFKRIDYFPRGANEPFAELERFNTEYPSLVVEPTISLIYPYALFFFVAPDNRQLHDAIKLGLERAHADGSFYDFFQSHPVTQKMIVKAGLQERTKITISNKTMSEETLNIPGEYWFSEDWLKD